MRSATSSLRPSIRSNHHSAEQDLIAALRTMKPDPNSYKVLLEVQNIVNRLAACGTPYRDCYSIINKLKKLTPEERINDLSLTNALMIENLIMEEQTKSLSKYVLKDTFDFGIKNYYNKVAQSVKTRLLTKGIRPHDNSRLMEQKKKSALRKFQMIKHYRLHNTMPKITTISRSKTNSQVSTPKSKPGLNINFRRHNCYIQRHPNRGSKERLSHVSTYFNQ